ncbi:MAG: hypothetical protein J6X55_13975 [Victivallales bacterium]|nr:hypothetical protein [Victivallales bacterium]
MMQRFCTLLAIFLCTASFASPSLQEELKRIGDTGDIRFAFEGADVRITTPHIELVLNGPARNYCVKQFGRRGEPRDFFSFFSASLFDKSSCSEYYTMHRMRDVVLTKRDGSLTFTVTTELPNFTVVRTLELFPDRRFFKQTLEVTATAEIQTSRVIAHVIVDKTKRLIAWSDGQGPSFRKNTKPAWFNIPRPDVVPCIAYLGENGKDGVAVISANMPNWHENPGQLLSSAGQDGGFTLELSKWGGRDARKGDSTYYELFFAPVADLDDAIAVYQDIMP